MRGAIPGSETTLSKILFTIIPVYLPKISSKSIVIYYSISIYKCQLIYLAIGLSIRRLRDVDGDTFHSLSLAIMVAFGVLFIYNLYILGRFEKLEIIGKGLGRNRPWNPFRREKIPVDERRFHHPIQEIILSEILQDEAALETLNLLPENIVAELTEIGVGLDSIGDTLTEQLRHQLNYYATCWFAKNKGKNLPYYNRHSLNFNAVGVGLDIATVVARTVYRELEADLGTAEGTQEIMFEDFVREFHQSFQRNIIRPGLTMLSAKAVRPEDLLGAIYADDPRILKMQSEYLRNRDSADIGRVLSERLTSLIAQSMPGEGDSIKFGRLRDIITAIGPAKVGDIIKYNIDILYDEEGYVKDLDTLSPDTISNLLGSIGHDSGREFLNSLPSIDYIFKLLTNRYIQSDVLNPDLMSTCPRTHVEMIDKHILYEVQTRYGQTFGESLAGLKAAGGLDPIYGCPAFHAKTDQSTGLTGLLPSDKATYTFIDYTNALLLKTIDKNWRLIAQYGLA